MANLLLSGHLQPGGDGCGCSSGANGGSRKLSFACGTEYFQTIVGTEAPIRVATAGILGAEFVDLDILDQLDAIEFLYMTSDQPVMLRLGAQEAQLLGTAIVFPVNTLGGETFIFEIDGVPVTYTAPAGSFATIAALANALNGAAAAAGLATPRFTAPSATPTSLLISGIETGIGGNVTIGNGTLNAQIGFTNGQTANGSGSDVTFQGLWMTQFQKYPLAPTRVQISGSANIQVLAAGRTSP
jgi:hypothetical protein